MSQCHGSDLLTLRLHFAHKSAVSFVTSPTFWKLSSLAWLLLLPGSNAHFVSPFDAFRLADFAFAKPPESLAPCWRTVATVYPLGNCDSLKPETSLSYLTRFETVSNRFWPLSSFFAFTDSARTLPEELVNPASGLCISRCKLRGVAPTSLTRPFPGHPGLSLRCFANFFRPSPSISALSMNCEHHSDFFDSEYVFLSTELFTKKISEQILET